jgi:hypothetical protein
LVNLGNLATEPGSGSGLEDSDPLTDRIPRSKDPDPESVGFGFVPGTNSGESGFLIINWEPNLDLLGQKCPNEPNSDSLRVGSVPPLVELDRSLQYP